MLSPMMHVPVAQDADVPDTLFCDALFQRHVVRLLFLYARFAEMAAARMNAARARALSACVATVQRLGETADWTERMRMVHAAGGIDRLAASVWVEDGGDQHRTLLSLAVSVQYCWGQLLLLMGCATGHIRTDAELQRCAAEIATQQQCTSRRHRAPPA